ncbi:YobI family P-loop NTPase [Aeromonas veronii]|uniref:YobI family P-loop NTPase n=1 Tax=Aeromonas veronii TaxID=654 RepID=UPI003F79C302
MEKMCDMMVCQKNTSSEPWNLVPLTPEYLEAEHGRYVAAIESALADEQIRNIALSGNYGVGKSSILQEVARRQKDRVVELSLSTLAPIEMSQLDESVPKQATTQTNRIQQEIVKQLLYREEPSKTPGSRFQRIQRFRWPREVGMAVVLGFVCTIIFLLAGWTDQIVASLTILKNVGDWAHAGVLGLGAGAALLVRWWFYGKFHIKQFSAASATVTLDDHSVSYFDQYLDEIVYFFEVSEHDVVIFEDIDRFNDSYIFETLRALNTLLNTAPQIKNSVRFIYAIKDSIFDQIGLEAEGRKLEVGIATTDDPALVESARANRTKFFDMVIPVVPFITHRSARNLATQLLGKIDHDVDPALLDLAAQYVPDMRLLKNIRNEFIVFRDRIFSGEGEQLQLSETDLFAMMLYKSTHLTDFEKIRLGKSNLDFLYKLSREMVVSNIKRLESECGKIRYRLARIDGVTTRSKQLGEKLILHIQRTAEAVGHQWEYYTFSFSSQSSLSRDDLKGVSFWASFVEADADDAVLICRNNNNYRNPVSFSRKNLAVALDDPLDAESWNEGEHKILTEQIEDNQNDIKFLRSADLSELVKHPEFLVIYEKSELSLDEVAKSILQLGLAYQLVRAGYLNRNFTLYTSTFHGDRVSPAATNFIIHHIERDLMDEHFELSPDDVDAVVRERGKNALKESALYNIAILDHLLVADLKGADIMVSSLAELGHNQTRFLQSYLSAGKQSSAFIKRFTAVCTRVLVYLVSQVELEEGLRLQLVDMALAHLTSSKLRTDSAVIKYLSTHYSEFMSLTSDSTESAIAERIGNLYADSSIKVSSLKHLGKSVCSSFVSRNMYEITHENLTIAISNTHTVALDVIRTANNTTYEYVLAHLGAYLNNTKGLTTTIDANEYFNIVIEDVLGREESLLGDVIERAATNCIITDLNDVSDTAWPALAEHLRFPATFNNISCYFEVFNSIDSHLAKVLTHAGCITEIKKNEDKLKEKIAVAVLEAKVDIPSPVLRVELVTSLDLGEFLNVEDVAPEAGELFSAAKK